MRGGGTRIGRAPRPTHPEKDRFTPERLPRIGTVQPLVLPTDSREVLQEAFFTQRPEPFPVGAKEEREAREAGAGLGLISSILPSRALPFCPQRSWPRHKPPPPSPPAPHPPPTSPSLVIRAVLQADDTPADAGLAAPLKPRACSRAPCRPVTEVFGFGGLDLPGRWRLLHSAKRGWLVASPGRLAA